MKLVLWLKAVRRFLLAEKKINKKIPSIKKRFSVWERYNCLLKGFNTDKLVWYDFKTFNASDYISDFDHQLYFNSIDREHWYVANDKLVLERFVSPFCNVIETIGFINKGRFYAIGSENRISTVEELFLALDTMDFFLKPNNGGSGRGIGKLWKKDGVCYWNNEQISSIETLICDMDDYLVQRRFSQTGYSHDVNPDTLNTVRITTMIDPETGEPFVGYACHRFGRKGAFVDNIAQANLLCPIDIEKGIIKYATLYPLKGVLEKVDKHPDTCEPISNMPVPHWDSIVTLAFQLAKQLPFMPLCGWDIIVSGDEIYVQELNFNPDIYLGQIDMPMLLNEKVRKFYYYYKK